MQMWSNRWKKKEMADFLKRIGYLMEKGYSLSDSLELYAINVRKQIQEQIAEMLQQLKNGERLFEILRQFDFPNDVVASLYFFERYDLTEGLIQGGNLLEKREAFKDKLQKVLQYPLFLIWLTSMMVYLLFRYLLPQFSNLYSSVGSGLPKASQIIITSVKALPFVLLMSSILLFVVATFIFIKLRHKSPRAKLTVLLKFPFIRSLTQLLITQRFSLNLSSLLHAGVSINEAIHIFEQQTYSPFFQQEAFDIRFRLLSGESLEEIMHKRSLYQNELAAIIKHGQLNGRLADELAIYAEILLKKIEEFFIKSINIIQPVIFSIVGLIVLLMFLAVMLPMLQFIQSL